MRLVRALPGTLGVLAFVLLPAGIAVLNLGAGLAQLEGSHPAPHANQAPKMLVGRYVSSPAGDDRIDFALVRAR